jgi:predicted transcriptional regulator
MSASEQLTQAAMVAKEKNAYRTTPRELVKWFGYSRRGSWIVSIIRKDLRKLGVRTDPDFESVWMDVPISLVPVKDEKPDGKQPVKDRNGSSGESPALPKAEPAEVSPSHRISRLKAANTKPISVKLNDKLETAVTLMMSHDFSQLPVMNGERDVKGMVSWRSIGNRLALNKKCEFVKDSIEPHYEVKDTASMFDVIRLLARYECVLIRDGTNLITGIVTAADISEQFQLISEPFILLGDIENELRTLIDRSFSIEELKAARDSADTNRKVESAANLGFGEYLRLLENPDNWSKLKLPLDRVVFTRTLNEVRGIRNDVMHFDPDGIDDDAQKTLRRFAAFMERLDKLAMQ